MIELRKVFMHGLRKQAIEIHVDGKLDFAAINPAEVARRLAAFGIDDPDSSSNEVE